MQIYSSFSSLYSLFQEGSVTNTEELIDTIQSAGLDGFEINCYYLNLPDILSFTTPLSLRDFDCSKVCLHSNHIDFNPSSINPHTRRAGIVQLKEEMHIAEEHGIRTLTIHPGFVKKKFPVPWL